MSLPPLVLALDPGKSSGIALITTWDGEPKIEWSDELDFMNTCNRINATLLAYRDSHTNKSNVQVVCESFTITPQTGKNSAAPWSLKLIGVAEYLTAAYGAPPMVMQTPQRAKNFVPNDRLKALEFWHRGGAGHAKDALRHGVLYLVDQGWRPEKLLVK